MVQSLTASATWEIKQQVDPTMSADPKDPKPTYQRFISLAFQMVAVIGVGGYLGHLADERSPSDFPTWLLLGTFLGIAVAFYQLFKSLPKS